MSEKKLFCAHVIKDKLSGGGNSNISDVKFCWAKSYDDAVKVFANANWPQYFWVEGKSVCRIIKIFEMFTDEFVNGLDQDLENILTKDVLRCLPVEQMNGELYVAERTEEVDTSSPEPKKSRREKAVAALTDSSESSTESEPVEETPSKELTKKSGGGSRRRRKRQSVCEVEPPSAEQSPEDSVAEARRTRRLKGAADRLGKRETASKESATRRRRKRK